MADGILCLHCGWQETEHELMPKEGRKKVRGRQFSLARCPGYKPEDPELAEELEELAYRQELRNMGLKPEGE